MLYTADIADPDATRAFSAFRALIGPALRDVVRSPLRRARHAGRACRDPVSLHWCHDCEQTVDDLFLDIFSGLRSVLAGRTARTRAGVPVREVALVAEHLASPAAYADDLASCAARLRCPPARGEPPWLRATRAQLVHYPTRHLEAAVRRTDAIARGGSARPDRDLRQAVWAQPLRADPADLDLLQAVLGRLRRGAADPFAVPDDVPSRCGLDAATARRRTWDALTRLRELRPEFYAANVTALLPVEDLPDDDRPPPPAVSPGGRDVAGDPEVWVLAGEEARASRMLLSRLVAPVSERARLRREVYRTVLARVCAADGGASEADPVGACSRLLGLDGLAAERFVRRLARLIGTAGVDWVEDLVRPRVAGTPHLRAGAIPSSCPTSTYPIPTAVRSPTPA